MHAVVKLVFIFLLAIIFAQPKAATAESTTSFDIKIIDSNFSPEDTSLIKVIKSAWDIKCKDKDPSLNCMLHERDIFPVSENPAHALLFRGELQRRPLGQSAFAAFAQKYPSTCNVTPCTPQELVEALLRILKKMPGEAPGAFCALNSGSSVFNLQTDSWFEIGRRDRCQGNPLSLLGNKHITGTNDIKIQKGGDSFPFDPFISLSQDPNIGLKFAKFHEDKSGQLLIVSVDEKRIPYVSFKQSEVPYESKSFSAIGNYFRLTETVNYAIEREVSAYIAIPKEDIKLIISPIP